MAPHVLYRKRMRTLLLFSAAAIVLGMTGVAMPRGDVNGRGGGGLMCGYFFDPSTGTTQGMTGSFFVGRKRWLKEPVADVATVSLATWPMAGGSPDIMLKADCIDIARQAMLRDAATSSIPDAAALVESALASSSGAAEHAYWWQYLVAALRIAGPALTILGCVGLAVFLEVLRRRWQRATAEGNGTLCSHCGYELAGLLVQTGGARGAVLTVCPECGKAQTAERQRVEPPLTGTTETLLWVLIVVLVSFAFAAASRWQS